MKKIRTMVFGFAAMAVFLGLAFAARAAAPNNSTPVLFAPDAAATSVQSGQIMSFGLVGFDLDAADILNFSAQNMPLGSSLDSTIGIFTWPTSAAQPGGYNVDFTVTDGIDSNTISVLLTVLSPVSVPSSTPTTTPGGSPTSTPSKYQRDHDHDRHDEDRKDKKERKSTRGDRKKISK